MGGANSSTAALDPPIPLKPDHKLKRRESQALEQGLTLHAHCGGLVRELGQCLRDHKLQGDPFDEELGLARDHPCARAHAAWTQCGRNFLSSTEHTQKRCAAQVAEAREACLQKRADCDALESAALRCLGTRMQISMSTGRFPPGMPDGTAAR